VKQPIAEPTQQSKDQVQVEDVTGQHNSDAEDRRGCTPRGRNLDNDREEKRKTTSTDITMQNRQKLH
jgi:hypothetical protein